MLGRLSMVIHSLSPTIEMRIGGYLYGKFHRGSKRSSVEEVRDKRRGFMKKYE